jgi:hypothetical protein
MTDFCFPCPKCNSSTVLDEEKKWIYCKQTYDTHTYSLEEGNFKCLTRIDAETGTDYYGTVFWTRIEDNNPLTGMPVRYVAGIQWNRVAIKPLQAGGAPGGPGAGRKGTG